MDIFAVLYLCSAYLLLRNGLAHIEADSLCNIYVLIADTRFRRIKGLARIIHYLPFIPWHRITHFPSCRARWT